MQDTIEGGARETDRLLAGIQRAAAPPLRSMSIAMARKAYIQAVRLLDIATPPAVDIVEHAVPATGGTIALRVSTPKAVNPEPTWMLWAHGGAFCVGDARATDAVCGWIAQRTGACVASVDYRLAPEHGLHVAVADIRAALRWCAGRAPHARLAVGGDSAGATLVLNAVLDEDGAHMERLASLVLCYPLAAGGRSTPSRERYANGHFLSMDDLLWFHGLASKVDAEGTGARTDLLRRVNWKSLPATMVLLAGRDPLHDEGRELAALLRTHSQRVEEVLLPQLVHGFLHMGGMIPAARIAHERIAAFLAAGME